MLFCTPMFGGKCEREFFESCLNLKDSLNAAGVPHAFLTTAGESLITRARCKQASTFLNETDFEAMVFLDADLEFSPADVAALWNLADAGKRVVGGCYSRKLPGEVPMVWKDGVERRLDEFTEPFACDRLATGFLLIHRAALSRIIERGAAIDYDESGQTWEFFNTPVQEWGGLKGAEVTPEWRRRWMPSEDYYFSDLWRAVGGECWTDPGIKLKHWGRAAY